MINDSKASFNITVHGISFMNQKLNIGVKNMGLRLNVDNVIHDVQFQDAIEKDGGLVATGVISSGLTVHTVIMPVNNLDAIIVTHKICNLSPRPIWINSAATGQFAADASILHGKGGWLGMDLRYCHT
ncbi:MAG: hypothetical protein WCO98_05625, partial [bacterium]